ncbi:MAG: hypothetical protein DME72_01095 [Verrucomicrobia bacterium]|nr:MAG: hypothetical protein DME72_01095 [Verrucomicrobiota bacterium]
MQHIVIITDQLPTARNILQRDASRIAQHVVQHRERCRAASAGLDYDQKLDANSFKRERNFPAIAFSSFSRSKNACRRL